MGFMTAIQQAIPIYTKLLFNTTKYIDSYKDLHQIVLLKTTILIPGFEGKKTKQTSKTSQNYIKYMYTTTVSILNSKSKRHPFTLLTYKLFHHDIQYKLN